MLMTLVDALIEVHIYRVYPMHIKPNNQYLNQNVFVYYTKKVTWLPFFYWF